MFLSLQDALSAYDFLKRNSTVMEPDMDGLLERDFHYPDPELTSILKDTEIRSDSHVLIVFLAFKVCEIVCLNVQDEYSNCSYF